MNELGMNEFVRLVVESSVVILSNQVSHLSHVLSWWIFGTTVMTFLRSSGVSNINLLMKKVQVGMVFPLYPVPPSSLLFPRRCIRRFEKFPNTLLSQRWQRFFSCPDFSDNCTSNSFFTGHTTDWVDRMTTVTSPHWWSTFTHTFTNTVSFFFLWQLVRPLNPSKSLRSCNHRWRLMGHPTNHRRVDEKTYVFSSVRVLK